MVSVWRINSDFCQQTSVDLFWNWKYRRTQSMLMWTELEHPKCSLPFLRRVTSIPANLQILAQGPVENEKYVLGKVPDDAGSSWYMSLARTCWFTVSTLSGRKVQLKANANIVHLCWWESPVLHEHLWLWSNRKLRRALEWWNQRLLK